MVAATTISSSPKRFINKVAIFLLAFAMFLVLYAVDVQGQPPPEQPDGPQLNTIVFQYRPTAGSYGLSTCDVKSQKLSFSTLKQKDQSDDQLNCQTEADEQNNVICTYGGQAVECKTVKDLCKQQFKGDYKVAFGRCL